MFERIFIGLGSNIDPETNIPEALHRLAGSCAILALSAFHRSPASGDPDGPLFVNGVLELSTALGPEAVKWNLLRPIEAEMGRVRTDDKNAPRTIDLDLLLYGNREIDTPRLTLPDPSIQRYPFVAVPLLELAPELVLPDLGIALLKVVGSMDASGLRPMPDFSDSLKRLFVPR